MKKYILLLLFSMLCLPGPLFAELWKCGETYTNQPSEAADCQLIQGSRTCGLDGNRYITPSKQGLEPKNDDCIFDTPREILSPMVNLKLAEDFVTHRGGYIKKEEPLPLPQPQNPPLPSEADMQHLLTSDIDDLLPAGSSELLPENFEDLLSGLTQSGDLSNLNLEDLLSGQNMHQVISNFVQYQEDTKCVADTLQGHGDITDCLGQ